MKNGAFEHREEKADRKLEPFVTVIGENIRKGFYNKDGKREGLCAEVFLRGAEGRKCFWIGTLKGGKQEGEWIECDCKKYEYTIMLFQNGIHVTGGDRKFKCRPLGDTARSWDAFCERVLKKLEDLDRPIFDFRPILKREWGIENDLYKKEYMEKLPYKLIRHVKDGPSYLCLEMKKAPKTKRSVRKRLQAGEKEGGKSFKNSKQK